MKVRLLAALTGLAILASLGASTPASASATRASNTTTLVCTLGINKFTYTVYWSNTTNHRVSIDEVFVASAERNGVYVNIKDVEVWVVRPGSGGTVHDNQVNNLNRSSADFYWPQSWITASSSTNAAVVGIAINNNYMLDTNCQKEAYFWG